MIKELITGHELLCEANKIKSLNIIQEYPMPRKSVHSIMWTKIDIDHMPPEAYIFKHRLVFKTVNGKTMIVHRPLDKWLVDKYSLEYYIILPE